MIHSEFGKVKIAGLASFVIVWMLRLKLRVDLWIKEAINDEADD
jgi:hypothetical protein